MMQGTLHRRVLEEHGTEAGAGAVMVLRDVSVYAPTQTRRYLTVTPANVLRVFGPSTAAGPEAEAAMRVATTPGQGAAAGEEAEEGDHAALAALTQLSQRLASQDQSRVVERSQQPRTTQAASRRLAVPRSEPRRGGTAQASARDARVDRGGGAQRQSYPGRSGAAQVRAPSQAQGLPQQRPAGAARGAASREPSSVDADVDALLAGLDADDFMAGGL